MASLLTTISTGFRHNDKPVITEEFIEEDNGSIKKSVKTGYETDEVTESQKQIPTVDIDDVTFEESVKDTVDTGFGEGTLHKECPEPELVQYLRKDKHLSEFKTDTDKELARQNLGVYSSTKVDQLLKEITNSVGSIYVTKSELTVELAKLDFVDSTLKAYANYEVPNNLFRL
jgi:hypothetical protein